MSDPLYEATESYVSGILLRSRRPHRGAGGGIPEAAAHRFNELSLLSGSAEDASQPPLAPSSPPERHRVTPPPTHPPHHPTPPTRNQRQGAEGHTPPSRFTQNRLLARSESCSETYLVTFPLGQAFYLLVDHRRQQGRRYSGRDVLGSPAPPPPPPTPPPTPTPPPPIPRTTQLQLVNQAPDRATSRRTRPV